METSRQHPVIALTAAGLGASAAQTSGEEPPRMATAAGEGAAPEWVDPHFHFLDPVKNPEQHATLLSAHPDLSPYLPEVCVCVRARARAYVCPVRPLPLISSF